MTLRDYFAAAALGGMLAHSRGNPPHGYRVPPGENWHTCIAGEAYTIAEAMLAQREKERAL